MNNLILGILIFIFICMILCTIFDIVTKNKRDIKCMVFLYSIYIVAIALYLPTRNDKRTFTIPTIEDVNNGEAHIDTVLIYKWN